MRWVLFVLLVAGCHTYPGNGPLISVHLDGDVSAELTEWIDEATHVWDPMGTQFRLNAPDAQFNLPLHYAGVPWYDAESCTGSCVGVYLQDSGEIWILPSRVGERTQVINVAAHELGHAIGLQHIADGIMAPYTSTDIALRPDDIAEWHRVYGP